MISLFHFAFYNNSPSCIFLFCVVLNTTYFKYKDEKMNFYNTKPDYIFHSNLQANIITRLLCYAQLLQLFSTLYDPVDWCPPGSISVHRILQARILE